MEAILKFSLPEDKEEFDSANRGTDWALMAWDIDAWCRNASKYGSNTSTPEEAYQSVRDLIQDMMTNRGLTFPE